jgi:hypothetical protein
MVDGENTAKDKNSTAQVHRFTQIKPYVGEFEGRRKAPQRGDWGSEPPDPGSVHTKKNRNPQILIIVPTC